MFEIPEDSSMAFKFTHVAHRRSDGSFVCHTVDGSPYHVEVGTPWGDEITAMTRGVNFEPEPVYSAPSIDLSTAGLADLPPVQQEQIIAALIGDRLLTEAEGIAWMTGTLPAPVEAVITAMPADQRVVARLRAIRPISVVPTDPLFAGLAAANGRDETWLVEMFRAAAAL